MKGVSSSLQGHSAHLLSVYQLFTVIKQQVGEGNCCQTFISKLHQIVCLCCVSPQTLSSKLWPVCNIHAPVSAPIQTASETLNGVLS